MANKLLTISMITRQAIRLWRNSNAFLMHINRQYDKSFAENGAKIGDQLRVRYPNDFTVRTGPVAQVQDTSELQTTLTLADQNGVDVSYSSVDRALSLDDFSERVLAPMVNNLTGYVATGVMSIAALQASSYVSNVTGGVMSSPTQKTIAQARAALLNYSAPPSPRRFVTSPDSNANILAQLTTLYNPVSDISKQYASGQMGDALGFRFMEDQTVQIFTTGNLTQNSAQVNGAGQTGTNLVVLPLAASINEGDILTIAGVYAANRITKQSQGKLATFVATQFVPAGATSIPIYPAIIPPAANGSQTQYQTVMQSPANGAYVNPVDALAPGTSYVRNLAFVPEAITFVTADLPIPRGVHEAHRDQYDGVSMRMITDYNIGTDQYITRLDVLWGATVLRGEWMVVVPDVPVAA